MYFNSLYSDFLMKITENYSLIFISMIFAHELNLEDKIESKMHEKIE